MTLPGDLAFFRGDPHHRIDALIMRRTRSPWVHVGVIVDHGLMLSARSDGVRIEPLPSGAVLAHTGDTPLPACGDALTWLYQQAGNAYGFGDILNQWLIWLNANTPKWVSSWLDIPTLSFARHKDCSHLALDFLRIAGYPFTASAHIATLEPERVTPGLLATILTLDTNTTAAETSGVTA